MCEPIRTGVCECLGTARLVCGCGICQKCGRTINGKGVPLGEIK